MKNKQKNKDKESILNIFAQATGKYGNMGLILMVNVLFWVFIYTKVIKVYIYESTFLFLLAIFFGIIGGFLGIYRIISQENKKKSSSNVVKKKKGSGKSA